MGLGDWDLETQLEDINLLRLRVELLHASMVDFVSRVESPQPPLERGALKVPLSKGDLGGFRPFTLLVKIDLHRRASC